MKQLTLEYMEKLEEEFTLNNYSGIKTQEESFKILKGDIPILISCPHAIDQRRNTMLKPRELYSGAICKLIQEMTNCYAIYKYHNDGIDDNFVMHTKYKDHIGKLIKEEDILLVIDIHGMVGSKSKRYRGYSIELGTDNGKNLLGQKHIAQNMLDIFKKHGIDKVVVDKKFRASKEYTIAKYVSKHYNTPAVQIEISGDYRNALDYGIENVKKLLNAFNEILLSLD